MTRCGGSGKIHIPVKMNPMGHNGLNMPTTIADCPGCEDCPCPNCEGSGKVYQNRSVFTPLDTQRPQMVCPTCHGSGRRNSGL
jgi:DnaJ-class molecular chaperone